MSLIPTCVRPVATLLVLAGALALTGCGSTGGGAGGGGGGAGELVRPNIGTVEPGEAVAGNVSVTWHNLDPRNPDVTQTLVNESSEAGRALRSGRVSSSEVRVIPDEVMGTLIGEMEDVGYFANATPGMNLDTIPSTPGRRGVVIVTNNGRVWGLMLSTGLGRESPIPRSYTDCKGMILKLHGAVQGLEVQVNVDEDKVFSAPPIRMPRR